MGTALLIVAFVVETVLAAYCITTRSNHTRVRALVRVGALAGFVLLALVSGMQWDFRWYGLTLLLLVWGALGAVTLIRRSATTKEYRGGRVVRRAVLSLFLTFIGLTPSLVFPEHGSVATTGEFAVATATYSYTDPDRVETYTTTGEQRQLRVGLLYPQGAHGTYPLVVFSHGRTATKSSNTSLHNELASHGYVRLARS